MTGNATRTVLITGGSAGLGLALVRHYATRGDRVYVVARHADELAQVAGEVRFIGADLTAPEFTVPIAVRLATDGVQRLDLLIHNAADGWYGAPAAAPSDRVESIMSTNLWAPATLTRSLASRLDAASGRVVFIGSIAAFVPAPDYAAYAASKAALDGLARSLQAEWAGRIGVQVIHPGPIATGFHERVGAAAIDQRRFPTPAVVAMQVVSTIGRGGWRRFTSLPLAALAVASRWGAPLVDAVVRQRQRARRAHG